MSFNGNSTFLILWLPQAVSAWIKGISLNKTLTLTSVWKSFKKVTEVRYENFFSLMQNEQIILTITAREYLSRH